MAKPDIDWTDFRSVNVKMEDVEVGDILYEEGVQLVVLSKPISEENHIGKQWTFDAVSALGVRQYLTTEDSPYKLRLTWEPMYNPVLLISGKHWNRFK